MTTNLEPNMVKAIYRQAIDPKAGDGEGDAWWSEVGLELSGVLAAATLGEAAAMIAWWHHDWSSVGDTAQAAAQRIRRAGTRAKALHRSPKGTPK